MQWRRIRSPKYTRGSVRALANAAMVFLMVVAVAACTDRPETEDLGSDTLGVASADTAGAMDQPPYGEADTVEVTLTEYDIEMPTSLPAGSTTFKVTNEGTMEHNFEVEGPEMEESLSSNLAPGASEVLEVDLAPGSYTVYCPVADHRSQGMEFQLTVEENGTTAAAY